MHVVGAERLPHIAFALVQLDRPSGAGDRVREARAVLHLVHRQLMPADDPAGLADAERAIGAHPHIAEGFRIFAFQHVHDLVGLGLALDRLQRGADRLERGLHMRHVHKRGAAARKREGEAVLAHQAVFADHLLLTLGQFLARRDVRLVDILEHDHLRPVDRAIFRLAARQARKPGERGVAGSIDEAGRGNLHVAITGGEIELLDAAAVARDAPHHRAGDRLDAGLHHRLLDPAAERHLVVHDDGGVLRIAPVMQRALGAEVAQNVVGDAVRHLIRVRAIGEEPAERADDGIDRLAAERGLAVDQRYRAAEACRFD